MDPVPEDPENRNGGYWQFRVPKGKALAFFHEAVILCMANEFQAALEKGMFIPSLSGNRGCSAQVY